MADVVIASSEADARAAEAVEQHHAQMSGVLAALVDALVTAVPGAAAGAARQRLVDWCEHELLPHAWAEEEAMYPAAMATVEGRLLVQGMLAEHTVITGLVHSIAETSEPVRSATAAAALRVVFESHLAKENDLVLPLLLRTPGVSVASLLGGMHELLGAGRHETHAGAAVSAAGCGGAHACSCQEAETVGHPELDARSIPHAIRHATVLGALETVQPGAGLVLVAPHDPLPLLAQVRDRWPDRFRVDYLETGPEAWRLSFVRVAG